MHQLLQHKFDCLIGHLTTDAQRKAYKELLGAVHSETTKLENKIERLSKNTISDGPIPIEVCESPNSITRITFVPGERVTIKIPASIKSEKIKGDYIKIAEFVRDSYKGVHTIRSHIRWHNEFGYCMSFQGAKGKSRKCYQIKYKDGQFTGIF